MIGKLSSSLPLLSCSKWSPLRLGEGTLLTLHTQLAFMFGCAFRYLSLVYVVSTLLGSMAMNETKSLLSKGFYSKAGIQRVHKYIVNQRWGAHVSHPRPSPYPFFCSIQKPWGGYSRCFIFVLCLCLIHSLFLSHSLCPRPAIHRSIAQAHLPHLGVSLATDLSPLLHTMVMTCFVLSISDETPIIAVMVALSSLLVIVFIIIVLYMLR